MTIRAVMQGVPRYAVAVCAAGFLLAAATALAETTTKPGDATTTKSGEQHDQAHEHHHGHQPARGGHLVSIGDHAATLELVLQADTGKLDAYIGSCDPLDPIRIKQPTMEVGLQKVNGKDVQTTLTLKAVANIVTGDTVGDTSQFSATSDALKNAKNFAGTIREVVIKGASFTDVTFQTVDLPTAKHDDEKKEDDKKDAAKSETPKP